MSTTELKNKISKSLDVMDGHELKQAWLILKELKGQNKMPSIGTYKKKIESQIANGIAQLDRGEGTDFHEFIGNMKRKYGSK